MEDGSLNPQPCHAWKAEGEICYSIICQVNLQMKTIQKPKEKKVPNISGEVEAGRR